MFPLDSRSTRPVEGDEHRRFVETIAVLADMQSAPARDLNSERRLASMVNQMLHRMHSGQRDFPAAVEHSRIYKTRYLPRKWYENREDFQRVAIEHYGSVEAASRLEGPVVSPHQYYGGYFVGFFLGSDLGYEHEMGTQWYLYFTDDSGSFYIPVEAVEQALRVGY